MPNPGPTTRASLGLPSILDVNRQRSPGTNYDEPRRHKTQGYQERMDAVQGYISGQLTDEQAQETPGVRTGRPGPGYDPETWAPKTTSIWVDQWPGSPLSPGGVTSPDNIPGGLTPEQTQAWYDWFEQNPGEAFPGWANITPAPVPDAPGSTPLDSPTSSPIGGAILAGLGILLILGFSK